MNKIGIQVGAMMFGAVVAAAAAAVSVTLVVESVRPKSAPVRAVPEVPVEPEVSAEPEAEAPAPLPPRPAPRQQSHVIQPAPPAPPPVNVEAPEERKPTTTVEHQQREHELQAP
jgi:type IV secretory pathway VirB10-like protein